MNYTEALEYIHGTYKFGSKLGLENIQRLLNKLGNPQKEKKIIHVAGTNGKGSTSSIISTILLEEGYKVGLYTSPYLEEFNERIRINNENISNNDLANVVEKIKVVVDEIVNEGFTHPTEFEIITAAAFLYYHMKNVDFIILEVGMGGRFDATNIIEESLISVITPISMDHMQYLGNTIEDIAFEKCGIIKQNGTVISAVQEESVYGVIEKACKEKNVEFLKAADGCIELLDFNIDGQKFIYNYNNKKYELSTTLIGTYQIINMQTALTVIMKLQNKGIDVSDKSIKNAVSKAKWSGRLEIVSRNPIIVLDGAHNEAGIEYLKTSIQKYFNNRKKILVLGILEDKQYEIMIKNISNIFEKIIVTEPQNERKLNVKKIKEVVKLYNDDVEGYSDYKQAINRAIEIADDEDLICVAGSLYLIGNCRKYLKGLNA